MFFLPPRVRPVPAVLVVVPPKVKQPPKPKPDFVVAVVAPPNVKPVPVLVPPSPPAPSVSPVLVVAPPNVKPVDAVVVVPAPRLKLTVAVVVAGTPKCQIGIDYRSEFENKLTLVITHTKQLTSRDITSELFCNLPKVRPVGLAAPTVRPVEALVAVEPNPPKLSPVEAVVFGALNAKPVLLPKEIPLDVVEVVPVPKPPRPASESIHLEYNISNNLI